MGGCFRIPDCTGLALEDCVLERDEAACERMQEPNATCQRYGGGGHRNASGFSVPLRRWLEQFV